MSAICGIFNLNGEPVDSAMLRQMVAASPYRGDDGVGYWKNGNIGLAHIAFHLTPESVREKQPLKSAGGKLVLVADVRLDNRDELINTLFPGSQSNPTDPDLLLSAYRRWGDSCVKYLLGDFAFAVWNSDQRELFLARDPMGAYGFFYYFDGNRFIFSSEIAAILSLPGIDTSINESSVTRHLIGRTPNGEETFFQSISISPPAHCLKVNSQGVRKWRYWDIDPEKRIQYRSDDDYTDHFLQLLTDSVAARIRTVGQVGLSLSGGCDSTLVAAIASRLIADKLHHQQRLECYSYIFDEFPECDEREYIRAAVERYQLGSILIPGDDKTTFSDFAEQRVFTNFFSYDCYAQLPLSLSARASDAGCKVLLTGHYGDTLFDAPSCFVADAISERRYRDLYQWYKKFHREMEWRNYVIRCGLFPLVSDGAKQVVRKLFSPSLRALYPEVNNARLYTLSKEMNEQQSDAFHRLPAGKKYRYHSIMCSSWANGFVYGRSHFGNAFGIERVAPYFDKRLVEFVLAIPPEQVSRPGKHRYLQKNAMRRLLSSKIVDRESKTTYEPLLHAGIKKNWSTLHQVLMNDPLVIQQGWVEGTWLKHQIQVGYLKLNAFQIMKLVHLELWLRAVENARLTNDWAIPYQPIQHHP